MQKNASVGDYNRINRRKLGIQQSMANQITADGRHNILAQTLHLKDTGSTLLDRPKSQLYGRRKQDLNKTTNSKFFEATNLKLATDGSIKPGIPLGSIMTKDKTVKAAESTVLGLLSPQNVSQLEKTMKPVKSKMSEIIQ